MSSQELAIKSYYQNLRDNDFIDTNQICKLSLDFYLSNLLFKGDLSRVLYSKPDIAFRRRIETVGRGDIKGNDYNYVNLNLPYAVYSQAGNYEEDDRGSTQNAGQIVLGQVQPDTGIILKAAALKIKYEATVFFARRDDVNIASQLLYWETTPSFPTYFIVQHNLCGCPIDIPAFISLDSFDSNTDYNEKDWLEKVKIFPIKLEFTIRSYQTLIEAIDDTIELPTKFSGLYGYNKNNETVFTQKTSLIWADSKWTPNEYEKLMNKKQYDSMGNRIYLPQDYDPYALTEEAETSLDQLENGGKFVLTNINETVADSIIGYFDEIRECTLVEFHQLESKVTENSVTIEWKIDENQIESFDNIVIYIPGLVRDEIKDSTITTFEVPGLYPGSTYNCTIIVTSKSYNKITYRLDLKTKGESVMEKKLQDNIVGEHFQNTFTGKKLSDGLVNRTFSTK